MGDAFLYKSSDLQQGPVLGKSPKIATPAHVKLSVTAQMDYSLGFCKWNFDTLCFTP